MRKIQNLTAQIIHLEGFGQLIVEEALDGNWLINLTPEFAENDLTRINIGINHYFELGSHLKKHYDHRGFTSTEPLNGE